MDLDTIQQLQIEDREVRQWEQAQRTRILSLNVSSTTKQEMWNKVFRPLQESNIPY